jgi:hypothetical protein
MGDWQICTPARKDLLQSRLLARLGPKLVENLLGCTYAALNMVALGSLPYMI